MELVEKIIDGNRFTFINESIGTRTGFKHTCELFQNSTKKTNSTIYYINRTWESYRYQTARLTAVNNLITARKKAIKDLEMLQHGWKNCTKKRAQIIDEIAEQDEKIKLYRELYNSIR